MTHHAVTLGVKPCLRVKCKFWLGDDGWNGRSEQPIIAVQAGTCVRKIYRITSARRTSECRACSVRRWLLKSRDSTLIQPHHRKTSTNSLSRH